MKAFPNEVRDEMGYGLYLAQMGDRPHHAKTLSGFGHAKIVEIRETDRSGTYRVVYTIEMDACVFVLYAFQKKAKKGIATPKEEMDLIKRRLKDAELLYKKLIKGDSL